MYSQHPIKKILQLEEEKQKDSHILLLFRFLSINEIPEVFFSFVVWLQGEENGVLCFYKLQNFQFLSLMVFKVIPLSPDLFLIL